MDNFGEGAPGAFGIFAAQIGLLPILNSGLMFVPLLVGGLFALLLGVGIGWRVLKFARARLLRVCGGRRV